ncbi:hypothetical protein PSEUBRA_000179 [Kalmanozyma brasiliensis GHG001]|uniref:uncharacterized protein n=1 Tax=Kalmanozyma brasiliensis (strain GHG001) TaxID=1365824 RepID=UPI002867DE5A|nr:uncharacterized protein PSEUBRA_000179 [Kalmanozyma brasiliensis GHG001]KAF6766785.1 hypothetical protein PSEUBRA_000179 [Kalmanozyma brasiliensis GHG001]
MPNLGTLLSFPSNNGAGPSSTKQRTPIPPCSSHILVTDTIDSPALFVLVHFLRAANVINKASRSTLPPAIADRKGKRKAHTKVIWLGCNSDGLVHLKNITRKSAVHLDEEIRDGAFCWIDSSAAEESLAGGVAAMNVQEAGSAAEQALRKLYVRIAEQLQDAAPTEDQEADWTSRSLVVIDDLTALAWSLDPHDPSGQPIDVARLLTTWLSSVTSLATKYHASVITLMHSDATSSSKNGASDPVDECLFNNVLQRADVWVEVKELASGRARDCDGEITVHPLVRPSLARALPASNRAPPAKGPTATPPLQAFAIETPCPNRAKAMLYRIAPDGQSAALGGASVGSNTGRVQVWARGTGRGFL